MFQVIQRSKVGNRVWLWVCVVTHACLVIHESIHSSERWTCIHKYGCQDSVEKLSLHGYHSWTCTDFISLTWFNQRNYHNTVVAMLHKWPLSFHKFLLFHTQSLRYVPLVWWFDWMDPSPVLLVALLLSTHLLLQGAAGLIAYSFWRA